MTTRTLQGRLGDLPTFTYHKVYRDAVTKHKAVSFCNGNKTYTRRITRNCIEPKRWKNVEKPKNWPAGLKFPSDILKAVMYSNKSHTKTKKSTSKGNKPAATLTTVGDWCKECHSCHKVVESIGQLCACTTAPWDVNNSEEWRKANIDLRWAGDDFGVGTYALKSIERGTILSDYVGELVMDDPHNRMYQLDVCDDSDTLLACIDSLRMGNWTRFINHSCNANTEFAAGRLGGEVRYFVKATKHILPGEAVTADYQAFYWTTPNKNGVWCRCGEDGCKYSEAAYGKRMRKARANAKKRRNR